MFGRQKIQTAVVETEYGQSIGGTKMSGAICGDNRFKIIESAKRRLIEGTNITSSPDEMKVLDDMLLRMWQLGYLGNTARWERGMEYEFAYCSHCGRMQFADWDSSSEADEKIGTFHEEYPYCPGCGCKMEAHDVE